MKQTAIGLSDSTWNPIRGCKKMSEGCRHCWAERIAGRYAAKGQTYYGIAKLVDGLPVWTEKVRVVENLFLEPMGWPGRVIQVGTMTDLFYAKISDARRDRIFGLMALCPQHIFQVLTHRAIDMYDYFKDPAVWERIELAARAIYLEIYKKEYPSTGKLKGPMRHLWMGVSVEDEEAAVKRIEVLQMTPAALRFAACEPLLGPIDLSRRLKGRRPLGWVIAGGESGVEARPMRPTWVRSLRDQCVEAGVPFYMHQWGAWVPMDGEQVEAYGWPGAQYIWPDGQISVHLAKSDVKTMQAAGALLDGVAWTQMPETRI